MDSTETRTFFVYIIINLAMWL